MTGNRKPETDIGYSWFPILLILVLLLPGMVMAAGQSSGGVISPSEAAGLVSSVAQSAKQPDSMRETRIDLNKNAYDSHTLEAAVLVFDTNQKLQSTEAEKKATEECAKDIPAECVLLPDGTKNPNPLLCCQMKKARQMLAAKGVPPEIKTVKDAKITFEYLAYPGDKWLPVTGCGSNGVESASKSKTITSTEQGSKPVVTYYYAECKIDKKLYEGKKKISVRARLDLYENPTFAYREPPPSEQVEFVDNTFNPVLTLRGSLLNALSQPNNSTPCIIMFIILGLLFASMYFSGKSPVTLLDITTPRLPSPKSFAAGGQTLAPFGYTEMKGTIKAKAAKTMAAIGLLATTMKGDIRSATGGRSIVSRIETTSSSISGRGVAAGTLIGTGDIAENRKFFEALALAATKAGYQWHEIQALAKHIYNYSDKDHQTVQHILQRITAMGGRQRLVAESLNDYLKGARLFQSLEVLTGHPEIGQRSVFHQAIQKTLGRFVGINRFPTIGPLFLGGADSLVRSGRIVGRMTKGIATNGVQLVRETGKWAVQLRPEWESSLRYKAAGGGVAAFVQKQIDKKATPINIGGMFPVADKMGHFYKSLHAEVYKDMMRYLLKQMYRHHGMNFSMHEEALLQMAYRDMDILRNSGHISTAALAAMEAQIKTVLSNRGLGNEQKFNALLQLAAGMGVHLDQRLRAFAHEVAAVDAATYDDHVKLVALQSVLARENSASPAAQPNSTRDDSTWYSLVGRQSLHGSDLWEVMTLRRMIHDGESGMLTGGIADILKSGWLHNINRLTTLDPLHGGGHHELPEFMRNAAELQKINSRVRAYLNELLTPEGQTKFVELTNGKSAHGATVQEFMNVLFGTADMVRQQGFKQDAWLLKDKSGKRTWLGELDELGPHEKWWKVDMKRHWRDHIEEKEALALGQWVEYRFKRGYTSPYKASIESELDRYAQAKTWTPAERSFEAKKAWVKDQLREDIHNFSNSVYCHNAYGTTNETMRFYNACAAGFLLKALRDRGLAENHGDIQFLEHLDVNEPGQMQRFRRMLSETYRHEFSEVLKSQLNYDDVARTKQVWVMMAEGGYAPYKKGMMLSDHDRPLNGAPAIADSHGQMRRIDIDNVQIALPPSLQRQYSQVAHNPKPQEWEPFLNNMKEWAKTADYSGQKQFAAVLWRYANATHDYGKFWQDSSIKLVHKREVQPLAPSMLRFFGDEWPTVQKTMKPVRDFMLLFGDYVSRVAQTAGGSVYRASYDVTPTSELYRLSSFRLAQHVLTSKWEDEFADIADPVERRRIKSAYRELAISHGAYHQVWDYCIDRNPWRHSTSMGGVQSFGSYFHYGPSKPFPLHMNLGAYLDRGQYSSFMTWYGWPMKIAQYPFQPFVHMMRGVQMAMQGYPNRFSISDDPLRYYYYTSPRILEALQVMNPFSYKTGGGSGRVGKYFAGTSKSLSDMNIFKGSMEYHHLAGKVFERGLLQGPSDINIVKKGVYSTARTGEANPGSSYYDYRFRLQLDPYMAEYLAYRSGSASSFYAADPYVRQQALTNTTQRPVAAEALAIRRLQEMDQHGMLMNPIFGWFNPLLFAWHAPVPFLSSASPKELLTTYINKMRRGEGTGLMATARDAATKSYYAAGRLLQPHRLHEVKWCECGTPSLGYMCRRCHGRIYR